MSEGFRVDFPTNHASVPVPKLIKLASKNLEVEECVRIPTHDPE